MTKITVGCGEKTRFLGAGLGGLGAIDHEKKPGFYEKKAGWPRSGGQGLV